MHSRKGLFAFALLAARAVSAQGVADRGAQDSFAGAASFRAGLVAAELRLARPAPAVGRSPAAEWLEGQARGIAYDHVGGGFFEPDDAASPFTKRLDTNALAVRVFGQAYLATGGLFFREVAEESARFLVRDLRGSDGVFWRAVVPATSEAGLRFVSWTVEELQRFLGQARAKELLAVYELHDNLLTLRGTPFAGLASSRNILLFRRNRRARPGVDTSLDAKANAAAVVALARLGSRLDRGFALDAARRAGEGLAAAPLGPAERAHAAAAYAELAASQRDAAWTDHARRAAESAVREACRIERSGPKERLSCRWSDSENGAFETGLALLKALMHLARSGDGAAARQAARLEAALREEAMPGTAKGDLLAAACRDAGCSS